ncbi:unnamed protein product [Blepharisma stoltei]|uniref:Uncharacterized protein n=1 Tax=Blepharisma stoltei TaxID=1481888 RepID=A0AAU9K524_9CILI|nr:unnamed protein product [Blepharisma stoltei]
MNSLLLNPCWKYYICISILFAIRKNDDFNQLCKWWQLKSLWKFGKQMFNYQHVAGKLVPIGCFGILMCIIGNAIAWPLWGSIGSILLLTIFFKHWR